MARPLTPIRLKTIAEMDLEETEPVHNWRGFLDLPGGKNALSAFTFNVQLMFCSEIRNEIYSMVAKEPKTLPLRYKPKGKGLKGQTYMLSQVSRQIRKEFLPIWQRINKVRVPIEDVMTVLDIFFPLSRLQATTHKSAASTEEDNMVGKSAKDDTAQRAKAEINTKGLQGKTSCGGYLSMDLEDWRNPWFGHSSPIDFSLILDAMKKRPTVKFSFTFGGAKNARGVQGGLLRDMNRLLHINVPHTTNVQLHMDSLPFVDIAMAPEDWEAWGAADTKSVNGWREKMQDMGLRDLEIFKVGFRRRHDWSDMNQL